MGKNAQAIKKEFNSFASKISRLELLRRQLDMLDVEGFESDVRLIRAKMNDVNAVSSIERDIKTLQRKIAERSTHAFSKEKELTSMRQRISDLRNLIDKKHAVSLKKQLSSQEVDFVRDIPRLEKELKALHTSFESHMQGHHTKVDSGVGLLVDTKFDDFVAELKSELTKRLREKELSIGSHAHQELKEQQVLFEQKYKTLVNNLRQKYAQQIKDHLHVEVQKRFNATLSAKLAQEKKRVTAQVLKDNLIRLTNERKKMMHAFERELSRKEASLKMKYAQVLNKARKYRAADHVKVQEKLTSLAQEERALAQDKQRVDTRVARTQRLFNHHLKRLKKVHAVRIKQLKQREAAHEAHIRSKEQTLAQRTEHLRDLERKQRALLVSEKHALQDASERSEQARTQETQAERERLQRVFERKRLALRHMLAQRRKKQSLQLHHLIQKEKERIAALEHHREELAERSDDLVVIEEKHADQLHRERHALHEEFARKHGLLHKERKVFEQEREKLAKQKHVLMEQVRVIQKHQRAAFDKARSIMDEQVREHKKQQDAEFIQRASVLRAQMQAEVRRRTARIEETHKRHIDQEVKKREAGLRAGLKREFNAKYMKLLSQKQAELNRKKLLLEREVMGNLKKALR